MYRGTRVSSPHTRTALIAIVLIASLVAAMPASAVSIDWHAVKNYGQSIMRSRNSHCTAAANIAKYHGLQRPGETDERLVTYAYMYVKQCACGDREHLPVHWFIAEGLTKLFKTRNGGGVSIRERATHSSHAYERATWSQYVAAINANRPVVLSYCYAAGAAASVEAAKGRYEQAFSVVGIGYMTYGGQKLVIAHDGVRSSVEVGPATGARLDPATMGLNTVGKPWGQSGTTLYKWDGGQQNLLLVFTDA